MTQYNTIQLKRTGTAAKVPQLSDLHLAELAFNYADNKLYISDGANVQQINSTSYLTTVDNLPVPTATQITNLSNNLTNYLPLSGGSVTGDVVLAASGPDFTPATASSAASKGYVDAQLSGFESTLTGAVTTITSANLTANRVAVSDTNGKVAVSGVTTTELSYVSGVTSSIQDQLNAKLNLAGGTLTGELILNPASQTGTNDATTNGQVATAISDALTANNNAITGAVTTVQTNNLNTSVAVVSDPNGKIASSSTTATEIGYVSGVTSSIQTQINNANSNAVQIAGSTMTGTLVLAADPTAALDAATKGYVDTAVSTVNTSLTTGAASTILSTNLAADVVVVSDANGKIATSPVSTTELGYVQGVTSAIQTQIDGKLSLTGGTMSGSIVIPTGQHISIANAATAGTDAVNLNTLQNYTAALSFRLEAAALDDASTALPVSAPFVVDGYTVLNNDRVLFTNLATGNNQVYVATVAGASISWVAANDNNRTSPVAAVGDTLVIDNGTAHGLAGYTFTGTVWAQFNGGTQVTPGVGIAKSGNTVSVKLGAGVAALPTDDVGIDLLPAGGLFLTANGTTSDPSNADSQLAVHLYGTTLYRDDNGLKINAGGVTDVEINSSALSNGLTGGSGVAISVVADAGITVTSAGVGLDTTWADLRYINTSGDAMTGALTLSGSSYISELTAASQGFVKSQISALSDSYVGAVTTILTADLSPSLALVSDGSGKVAASSVTTTELGYVSGVTSAIQTQINGKVAKAGDTMTGTLTIATGANVVLTDAVDTTVGSFNVMSVNDLRAYVVDGGTF